MNITDTPVFHFEDYSFVSDYFQLLNGLTFEIMPGESVALVGPTGSGKSLLLNLMLQVVWSSGVSAKSWNQRGDLTILGHPCSPEPPHKKDLEHIQVNIALIRDQSVWLPLSVSENFLAIQKLANHKPIQSYENIVEEFATSSRNRATLLSFAEQYPSQIESPHLQLLTIIRALLRKPKAILLDEALIRMDPVLLKQTETLIQEKAFGATLIWATNDLYQASRVTDRTLFLVGGELFEDTETPKFFTNPKTQEAENFISGKELESFNNQ